MRIFKTRQARIAILALLVLIIAAQVFFRRAASQANFQATQTAADYDTGGTVPGDPNQSIQQMKQLFQMVELFRRRHQGAYPQESLDLLSDMMTHKEFYGVKDPASAQQLFKNPDTKFSDNEFARLHPDTFMPYYFKDKRFDGSLAGSPKAAGTHDVIATLDLYTHFNSVHRDGEIYTNPVGFYLVLYDDGTVAKVPYDQIRFVPVGNREYQFAYPNEAGVPNTALGYDEYHQKIMGWKAGPRGGVGSPGQSYAHQ